MSSIAQEEAKNISENVTCNVQKRFKEVVPDILKIEKVVIWVEYLRKLK